MKIAAGRDDLLSCGDFCFQSITDSGKRQGMVARDESGVI